jgi:hypothetical protein
MSDALKTADDSAIAVLDNETYDADKFKSSQTASTFARGTARTSAIAPSRGCITWSMSS